MTADHLDLLFPPRDPAEVEEQNTGRFKHQSVKWRSWRWRDICNSHQYHLFTELKILDCNTALAALTDLLSS